MNKTPLPKQLGFRYMRDMYHTAYMQRGNKLHCIQDFVEASNKVLCSTINLNDASPEWKQDEFSADEVVDFSAFKYPKLGYREMVDERLRTVVVYVEAVRSTRRGLQEQLMTYKALPVYDALVYGGRFEALDIHAGLRAQAVFRPKFTKFSVGLGKLLRGEQMGFAVSEDVALGVSVNRAADAVIDVYYRGRQVGVVDKAGQVTIYNKILQRLAAKTDLFS